MELFTDMQPWHWFVLGIVLLVVETFASTQFFIGIALAALALAAATWLGVDLTWQSQLGLFAVLSVLFTVSYFKFFRKVNQRTDEPLLNDRAAQLVGQTFELDVALEGDGAVMIHDTRWQARCEGRIEKGANVRVVGSEGMVLFLEPADS